MKQTVWKDRSRGKRSKKELVGFQSRARENFLILYEKDHIASKGKVNYSEAMHPGLQL